VVIPGRKCPDYSFLHHLFGGFSLGAASFQFHCCYVHFIIHHLSEAKAVAEVMARIDSMVLLCGVRMESCNAINPMIRTMNELQAIAEESGD
jgi:hypothetical protein